MRRTPFGNSLVLKPFIDSMKVIHGLRFCAVLPLALGILALFDFLAPQSHFSNATVTNKYQRDGFFTIEAEEDAGGESELTYSRRFYERAQNGDRLHFGFHYMSLRRDGKLIAMEIPEGSIFKLAWLIAVFFPALAFLPESKLPNALLPFIGIVEALIILSMLSTV